MPGLAPHNTSLLHKLGRKAAWEMSTEELLTKVTAEQIRRSFQRAMGRVIRMNKDKPKRQKATLESLGLAPEICERMRASGLSESQLIAKIQKVGLL